MKTKILIALLTLSTMCFGQATGIVYSNFNSSGPIGTAAATIDVHTFITIYQDTPNVKLAIPNPTATNQGKNITINNAGTVPLLLEPGGYIHPGKSMILRWSGIWQVSGSGEPSLKDSIGKVYAIDTSGYGKYRYLTPDDLPDSIPMQNVLTLTDALNGKLDTGDASNFIDAGTVGLYVDSLKQSIASKLDTADRSSFITQETDPIFVSSDAFQISMVMINGWMQAYDWGDHSVAGYIKKDSADERYALKNEVQDAINGSTAGKVPYSSYQAIVSQTGTSSPTVSRKDTCFAGTTFTWSRTGLGTYTLTASNPVFTSGNTVVIMSAERNGLHRYLATINSTTVITFSTTIQSIVSLVLTIAGQDDLFTNTLVEIRVYN